MLPQTPRAHPAEPVMTRCWCHRTKLDGEHIQDQPGLTSTSLAPKSTSPALSKRFSNFHSVALPTDAIAQVRTVPGRYVTALLLLLALIPQPAMSKPWSNMQPDHVIFRSRICQPLSVADLQKLMGPHYDQKKMAPDLNTAKRTFEDSGHSGYQADESRLGLTVDSADIFADENEFSSNEDVWMYAREEDMYTDNGMVEAIDDKAIVERRTWTPRRKMVNKKPQDRSHNRRRYRRYTNNNDDDSDDNENTKHTISTDPTSYKIRRRRRSSMDDSELPSRPVSLEAEKTSSFDEDVDENVNNNEYELDDEDSDDDFKDKKSTDSVLALKLHLNGKNKKLRRQLKQRFRKKGLNSSKPPPWECKFSQNARHMRRGIFPDMLLEGRCDTDKCFYRLYSCEPIKYAVKLLQRDPDQCNPLPTVGNVTVFEERWNLVQYHVTVGCSCSNPNVKNVKPKNRRRD